MLCNLMNQLTFSGLYGLVLARLGLFVATTVKPLIHPNPPISSTVLIVNVVVLISDIALILECLI